MAKAPQAQEPRNGVHVVVTADCSSQGTASGGAGGPGAWPGLPSWHSPPSFSQACVGTGQGGHSPDTFVEGKQLLIGQPLALEDGDHPVVDAAGGERGALCPDAPGPLPASPRPPFALLSLLGRATGRARSEARRRESRDQSSPWDPRFPPQPPDPAPPASPVPQASPGHLSRMSRIPQTHCASLPVLSDPLSPGQRLGPPPDGPKGSKTTDFETLGFSVAPSRPLLLPPLSTRGHALHRPCRGSCPQVLPLFLLSGSFLQITGGCLLWQHPLAWSCTLTCDL